jgi:hypothetical protein
MLRAGLITKHYQIMTELDKQQELWQTTEPGMEYGRVLSAAFSHRNLCFKATKHLRNKGIQPFHKSQYVVCELERVGESPDAFGFGGSSTQLIEVKVSRSDFLSDKKKYWRKYPEHGIGKFRSYLCPEGMIKEKDLPKYWGLLWINEKGKITEIVKPEAQPCNHIEELNLIVSILRREGISPRIFSYKNYSSDAVS